MAQKSYGFGFVPAESEHHFLVTIPASKKDRVYISEHFEWIEDVKKREALYSLAEGKVNLRVALRRLHWDGIAEETQKEFNRRLRDDGLKTARWKTGRNTVSRLLGKELVMLAWAVEEADPGLIPVAIKNWLGLRPEERWWLFTMTNAATGDAIRDKEKGWRKALKYALTENPIAERIDTGISLELFSNITQ